ncbi:MAG TPA: type II secretion system F family protein [Thermodesulfobacteriota bacterium]|nr:type II secretion system F family protein [Thermodesulfobacteriota bacterium]
MPVFTYEGRTAQGQVLRGEMEAISDAAVRVLLRRQGITPTKVAQKGRGLSMEIRLGGNRVKEKELVVFTRQFATMIDAGLPLVQCLDILAGQQPNPFFKKTITKIKEDVESGSTFHEALGKHPKVFDELYVSLVAAGEAAGILDTILNRLAAYIEKAMKLKSRIKGAMVYPGIIVTVAVGVVTILLVFVIPIFAKMFADFGGELPAPTKFVIDMSNWVKRWIAVMIGAAVAGAVVFRQWYKTPGGRRIVDSNLLKLPVVGDLIRKIAVARFTRTLGTMVASGVPILDGLQITAKTAGNKIVEAAILATRQSISEGRTIAEPLIKSGVFPPMVCQMIAVGESTGALDAMLNKIADFYDDEVDAAVGALTALMEPALMVFLGITIGGLVIAMYLPIFKIAGAVGA